eukprot:tig00000053_g23492.t1
MARAIHDGYVMHFALPACVSAVAEVDLDSQLVDEATSTRDRGSRARLDSVELSLSCNNASQSWRLRALDNSTAADDFEFLADIDVDSGGERWITAAPVEQHYNDSRMAMGCSLVHAIPKDLVTVPGRKLIVAVDENSLGLVLRLNFSVAAEEEAGTRGEAGGATAGGGGAQEGPDERVDIDVMGPLMECLQGAYVVHGGGGGKGGGAAGVDVGAGEEETEVIDVTAPPSLDLDLDSGAEEADAAAGDDNEAGPLTVDLPAPLIAGPASDADPSFLFSVPACLAARPYALPEENEAEEGGGEGGGEEGGPPAGPPRLLSAELVASCSRASVWEVGSSTSPEAGSELDLSAGAGGWSEVVPAAVESELEGCTASAPVTHLFADPGAPPPRALRLRLPGAHIYCATTLFVCRSFLSFLQARGFDGAEAEAAAAPLLACLRASLTGAGNATVPPAAAAGELEPSGPWPEPSLPTESDYPSDPYAEEAPIDIIYADPAVAVVGGQGAQSAAAAEGAGNKTASGSESDDTFRQALGVPVCTRSPSYWARVAGAAPKVVRAYAVFNPQDGPGGAPDPFYAKAVGDARAAGVTVLGYVRTGWGARPLRDALSDIGTTVGPDSTKLSFGCPLRARTPRDRRSPSDGYRALYKGVGGILFDEGSGACGAAGYYAALRRRVRRTFGSTAVRPGPGALYLKAF